MKSYTQNELAAKLLTLTTAKEETNELMSGDCSTEQYARYNALCNEITEQIDALTYVTKYALGDNITGDSSYLENKLKLITAHLEGYNELLESELDEDEYEEMLSDELEYDEDHIEYDSLKTRNKIMETCEFVEFAIYACHNLKNAVSPNALQDKHAELAYTIAESEYRVDWEPSDREQYKEREHQVQLLEEYKEHYKSLSVSLKLLGVEPTQPDEFVPEW